jgi:hypothetical protein
LSFAVGSVQRTRFMPAPAGTVSPCRNLVPCGDESLIAQWDARIVFHGYRPRSRIQDQTRHLSPMNHPRFGRFQKASVGITPYHVLVVKKSGAMTRMSSRTVILFPHGEAEGGKEATTIYAWHRGWRKVMV